MIHYHGTPLGGKRIDVTRFAFGRFFLIPFPRPEDLPAIADASRGFCIDNGAFSAWKQGKPITDWSLYYKFCKTWARHPRFHFALIPDAVDGDEKDNRKLIDQWNKKMYHPIMVEGCPVWHLHESFDYLRMLLKSRHVALGSSGEYATPGSDKWRDRMAEAMEVATDEDGRPLARLHGLRMLAPNIVRRYPLASADSTNVAQNKGLLSRFGIYCPPTGWQRAESIAARIEAIQSPPVWRKADDTQGEFLF